MNNFLEIGTIVNRNLSNIHKKINYLHKNILGLRYVLKSRTY